MLEKSYNPQDSEQKIYKKWEEQGLLKASEDKEKPVFSLVMPPPNVTGSLHMGHALDDSLPDVVLRYKRMKGYDVLWQPGMDHAGIATQMVVERELAKDGCTPAAFAPDPYKIPSFSNQIVLIPFSLYNKTHQNAKTY